MHTVQLEVVFAFVYRCHLRVLTQLYLYIVFVYAVLGVAGEVIPLYRYISKGKKPTDKQSFTYFLCNVAALFYSDSLQAAMPNLVIGTLLSGGMATLRHLHMMTSSIGNIFRVSGHLCWEFTGLRWIPRTKASDAELWYFLWSAAWIHSRVNNRETGDLRHHRAHIGVIVMVIMKFIEFCSGKWLRKCRQQNGSHFTFGLNVFILCCITTYTCIVFNDFDRIFHKYNRRLFIYYFLNRK